MDQSKPPNPNPNPKVTDKFKDLSDPAEKRKEMIRISKSLLTRYCQSIQDELDYLNMATMSGEEKDTLIESNKQFHIFKEIVAKIQ